MTRKAWNESVYTWKPIPEFPVVCPSFTLHMRKGVKIETRGCFRGNGILFQTGYSVRRK